MKEKSKVKVKVRLVQNIGIGSAKPSAPRNSLYLIRPSGSPRATANPVNPGCGNQRLRSPGGPSCRGEEPSNPQESLRHRSHDKHRESDKENQGERWKQIDGQDRLYNPGKSIVAGNVFDGIFRSLAEAAAFSCLAHVHPSFVHPREPQIARWREMTADRGPDAKIACADSPRSEKPCDVNRRRSGFVSDI